MMRHRRSSEVGVSDECSSAAKTMQSVGDEAFIDLLLLEEGVGGVSYECCSAAEATKNLPDDVVPQGYITFIWFMDKSLKSRTLCRDRMRFLMSALMVLLHYFTKKYILSSNLYFFCIFYVV